MRFLFWTSQLIMCVSEIVFGLVIAYAPSTISFHQQSIWLLGVAEIFAFILYYLFGYVTSRGKLLLLGLAAALSIGVAFGFVHALYIPLEVNPATEMFTWFTRATILSIAPSVCILGFINYADNDSILKD